MDIMLQLSVFLTNGGGSRIEANLGTPNILKGCFTLQNISLLYYANFG